ncbi:MAG: ribonuclease HII [Bacteroidales bacterium]
MVTYPALQSCYQNATIEAGCDEAGRGCLAGPVVAAAVILPPDFWHKHLNDSKQMSAKERLEVREVILERAVAWGIALCSPEEIDHINILKASILAMHRALAKLAVQPQLILVDGNRFLPYTSIPHICMVKGDSRFASIAAASVLAKTERDAIMDQLHVQYPVYQWDKNKGYPTAAHRKLVREYGPSPHHRESFRGVKSHPELPLQ